MGGDGSGKHDSHTGGALGWAGLSPDWKESGYERGENRVPGPPARPGLAEAGLSGENKMEFQKMGIHVVSPAP